MEPKPVLKVVKVGGNVISNPLSYATFLKNFAAISSPKLLIHGGGTKATQLAERLGIPIQITVGRRKTDAETLEVVTMCYAGLINKDLVARLQALDCNALGLTGADGNSIVAVKRAVKNIDYGFVGDVVQVNCEFLKTLIDKTIVPVFCSITHDWNGQLLNTNGDTLAMEIATAMTSVFDVSLYYCFDRNGVLMDLSNEVSVIPSINTKTYESLLGKKRVTDGMQPKLYNGFEALKRGVDCVGIGSETMIAEGNNKPYTRLVL